jgi:hypothetical protein
VLAGLAVVAVVAAVTIATAGVGVLAAGIIIGGTAAVGVCAVRDIASGEVGSMWSYIAAAAAGMVVGATLAASGALGAAAKGVGTLLKGASAKRMFLNGCDGVWDTLKENAIFRQETTFPDLVISFVISAFTAGQGDEAYRGYKKADGFVEGAAKKADEVVEGVAKKVDEVVEGVAKKVDEVIEGGSKTIDDIIDNLPETTNGKGVARNFESTGGFDQTIKDFDALNPIDVKEIQTQYGPGKVGKLSAGTTVVARPGSTTGGATLEIRVSNSKVYKIRY